ncbi:Retrovirus-related Gag polyprotein from transposon HMS-Beagle [Eumeta japonica]|uniref:Retrovirus-related Gag polyprotein from transposon HMS-Beagle n=1 Tax=Eumeta variegata TaxID=151549 RepID=A0A4C1TDH1_EUMVA|nr:Retrovirus-related Gag polyprotein from transposon HMS-Beagle [Eumeta japonica]
MANQNNLIRPPVLPQNQNPNNNPGQLSIEDLTTLISRISTEVLRNQGPQIVQAVLNPDVDTNDTRDQGINDGLRNNLNDLDKIPDVVKCLKEFSGQPGEFSSWKKA